MLHRGGFCHIPPARRQTNQALQDIKRTLEALFVASFVVSFVDSYTRLTLDSQEIRVYE